MQAASRAANHFATELPAGSGRFRLKPNPAPSPLPVRMPQIKRVFGQRVAMDADEKHICALVEDALRAVTVVVVHVEHNHPFGSLVQQSLDGHRCVVQKAVAAHEIRASMVARWPVQQNAAGAPAAMRMAALAAASAPALAASQVPWAKGVPLSIE